MLKQPNTEFTITRLNTITTCLTFLYHTVVVQQQNTTMEQMKEQSKRKKRSKRTKEKKFMQETINHFNDIFSSCMHV